MNSFQKAASAIRHVMNVLTATLLLVMTGGLVFEAIAAAMNNDWMRSWACGLGAFIFGVMGAVEYRSGKVRAKQFQNEGSAPTSTPADKS